MKKIALFLPLAMLLLAGCSFLQDNQPTARLTVQYATLKVIDGDLDKRDRVVEIAERALGRLDDTPEATIHAVVGEVREQVPWSSLDDADKILIDALLTELEARLIERYGDGVLSEEARLGAATVAQWVISAARMV